MIKPPIKLRLVPPSGTFPPEDLAEYDNRIALEPYALDVAPPPLSPEYIKEFEEGGRLALAYKINEIADVATETQEATPTDKRIKATPFDPGKWRNIPPREWLYGDHYIRSYVTGTSAPSTRGKSTLILAEDVSMMTGFDLLGVGASRMPDKPLKVWVWNGEDPEEELARRIKAICLYYGRIPKGEEPDEPPHTRYDFDFDSLKGKLYLDSGRDTPIKIAALEGHGNVKVAVPVIKDMVATINGEGIDVTNIDPFINAHSIPENSDHMDEVVGAFKDIAYQTRSSIEHVHHTRKPPRGSGDITSEDSRGSSAILAAWRDSRVINIMSAEEAKEQGVGNRLRYIRIESDRPNMTAAGERVQWCYLESVSLRNATGKRPADSIGVTVPWEPTIKSQAQAAADEPLILGALLKLIDAGKRITKTQGGDYAVKALVPYLKRESKLMATADEVRAVLDVACEDRRASGGADAVLYYMDDAKRGKAGYRRAGQ
jgi:hypothetical protein